MKNTVILDGDYASFFFSLLQSLFFNILLFHNKEKQMSESVEFKGDTTSTWRVVMLWLVFKGCWYLVNREG